MNVFAVENLRTNQDRLGWSEQIGKTTRRIGKVPEVDEPMRVALTQDHEPSALTGQRRVL